MADNVSLIRVDTGEAVKNIKDLKENIKLLKDNLNDLPIASDKYKETLKELQVNQNALKDAMYATSGSMEDVAKSAKGASDSYNSLVHEMARLKSEWRATNDEAKRNELGKQIGEINQRLKDMDASVGNFQRNVGNYESGVTGLVAKFDQFGGILKQMPPTLGAAKESIGKVGETMQLVGKQPILGIIGLIAPMIMKITESLKGNATAMDAVDKIMEGMKPIMDFFAGVLQLIAEGFSHLVDWLMQLAGNGGWFSKFASTISGVGNSVLQYLLTPIRTTIEAFKGLGNIIKDVFTGQWSEIKAHAEDAWSGIKGAFKEGFSFKENFKEGQRVGEEFVQGVISKKEDATKAAEELKDAMSLEEKYGLEEDSGEEDYDQFAVLKAEETERAKTDAFMNGLTERLVAREEAAQREIELEEAVAKANDEYLEEQKQKHKEYVKSRIADSTALASATSGLLNSIADALESNEESEKKNAKKTKALRVASATIDMLQGVVSALASASGGGPVGWAMGAVQAATITATGLANIAKIKSTNVENASDGASASVSASVPASVSAPSMDTSLQSVRNVTSASEEDRLNRMASSQKVYILQSDIEAANNQSKVQVAESSF